jgi:hypothetical protein
MAYIDQTKLNDYQSKVAEGEIRIPNYGLINLAKKETGRVPFLDESLRAVINDHEGIDLKVPALAETVITTTSSESFTIPANLSTSGSTTLTFTTIFAGYQIFPETFKNNVISEGAYRLNKIQEVDKAMAKALEDAIDTQLDTYKSAVWETGALTGYNFVSNILEVDLSSQNDVMFANVKSMAMLNDWSESDLSMAASPEIDYVLNEYRKYGMNNDKNLQFQTIPELFVSNRVTKTTGKRWTAYLCEPGALGVVENFKHPFKINKTVGEAKWGISDMELPQLGYRVMLYENQEKTSAEAVGSYGSGMIMSWVEEYGYIFRYCLLKRYNSDSTTRVGYILKLNGAAL